MALLETIYELAPTRSPREALRLGEAEWHAIEARPPKAEDAESCRLISLSAGVLQDFTSADLWRDRARSIGERIPWPELLAALDMAMAFKALAIRNDDYPRGRTLDVIQGSPEAVEIMQNLAPVAEGPGSGIQVTLRSPNVELIRRFVFEKAGSFQLALGDYDRAVQSFAKAVEAAEGPRGKLKARGGLALANYGRALLQNDDTAVVAALAETQDVAQQSDEAGEADVAATGTHNAEVMMRRGRDLLLYELL